MSDPIALGLWSVAIGMAGGVVAGLRTALVGDLVAPAQHGGAVGWLRTMTDAGRILGPAAMGALADATQLSAPFLFAAVLLIAIAWRCQRRAIPLFTSR